jgi:hypothetical protein
VTTTLALGGGAPSFVPALNGPQLVGLKLPNLLGAEKEMLPLRVVLFHVESLKHPPYQRILWSYS